MVPHSLRAYGLRLLEQAIVAAGGARHGIDWHYCRPPVVGLEYEMDTRAVHVERVLV